jgi:hypothetical protein
MAEEKDSNRVPEAELILPRGKKVILQAEDTDYKRGLIVELLDNGGYEMAYWYDKPDKPYPVEILVDGQSIKPDGKIVEMKFHPQDYYDEQDVNESLEDRDKVKEIKQLLTKIEDLSKNIDLDKFKYDGGLGTKDATLIQIMRQVISTFRLKKVMKENVAPNHDGKAAPYGSGYERVKKQVKESLRDWFKKENWVRINTSGNISGDCGTMKKGKATTRCLPRKKAQSLTKAQRKATVAKKVRGSKKGKQFVGNTKSAKYRKKSNEE